MQLAIDDLEVHFPFPRSYSEQKEYMLELKRALDTKNNLLIEMPSCSGRSTALLALLLAYRARHSDIAKLIICTSTVAAVERTLEELRVLEAYRCKCLGPTSQIIAGLPVRNSFEHASGEATHVQQQQHEYDSDFDDELEEFSLSAGVHSIAELVTHAAQRRWGVWRLATHVARVADVLVCVHQHLLDPKIAQLVASHIGQHSVVVFDEAHNLADAACQALSTHFTLQALDSGARALHGLAEKVALLSVPDSGAPAADSSTTDDTLELDRARKRLKWEYEQLVDRHDVVLPLEAMPPSEAVAEVEACGMATSWDDVYESFGALPLMRCRRQRHRERSAGGEGGEGGEGSAGDESGGEPLEAGAAAATLLPGNLRRARTFIRFMQRLLGYLRPRLSHASAAVSVETPNEFLHLLEREEPDMVLALPHVSGRLRTLLRTLERSDVEQHASLVLIADFATLVSTYRHSRGLGVILGPDETRTSVGGRLQLCCYDPAIVMRPLARRFRSVVVTSSTLSPLDEYAKVLGLDGQRQAGAQSAGRAAGAQSAGEAATQREAVVHFARAPMRLLFVTRDAGQEVLRTGLGALRTTEDREREGPLLLKFGKLLVDVAAVVPDGVVGCFASYAWLQAAVQKWQEAGLLRLAATHKLVFLETCSALETASALSAYKRACDGGRGAIFLTYARSKVVEAVDFSRHYGRALLLFGLPMPNLSDRSLTARRQWLAADRGIEEGTMLAAEAIRQATKCMDGMLRSKADYSLAILADARFDTPERRAMFSGWARQWISSSDCNISAVEAVAVARQHMRAMAQSHTAAADTNG